MWGYLLLQQTSTKSKPETYLMHTWCLIVTIWCVFGSCTDLSEFKAQRSHISLWHCSDITDQNNQQLFFQRWWLFEAVLTEIKWNISSQISRLLQDLVISLWVSLSKAQKLTSWHYTKCFPQNKICLSLVHSASSSGPICFWPLERFWLIVVVLGLTYWDAAKKLRTLSE